MTDQTNSTTDSKAITTEQNPDPKQQQSTAIDPNAAEPSKTTEKDVDNPYKGSKHKVKIDGQEIEVDYDDLLKDYQLSRVSRQKLNEAAKERNQAQDIIKLFKSDPELVGKEIGVDMVQWAQRIMQREAEAALLTPEQREHRKLLDELKALKDEKDQALRVREQQELQAKTQYHAAQLDQQFTQALSKAGLPKTHSTVQRMAQYMLEFAQAGHEVTPEDVVSYVLEDYQKEHQELWGASDLDQLYQQLGKDNVKKLIKLHNEEVTKKQSEKGASGNGVHSVSGVKKPAHTRKKKDAFKNFFDDLRGGSKIGGTKF